MARTQTLVQLTDELVALLDQRAGAAGVSRSELVRRAVEAYLAGDAEAAVDAAIIAAYTADPPEAPDDDATRSAIASIQAEPW